MLSTLVSPYTQTILEKALSGISLDRGELLHLLELEPNSADAAMLRLIGGRLSKQRFGGKAMLLCQTGIEAFPCPADCRFCSFGKTRSTLEPYRIPEKQLDAVNAMIHAEGDVYAHFLLFMHTFDFSFMLQSVERTRAALPSGTQVVLNCGDLDSVQLEELKSAGANGVYHVLRLGEGVDTNLTPEQRIRTIDAIKKTNLDWYTCCEPVGPEHSNTELLDKILFAAERECFQNAVMRRISVPGTALYEKGQISLLRSAQLVAVVAIAMLQNPHLSSIAIHEPDLLGLTAGANCVYAEYGVNPRDTELDTSKGRGFTAARCRAMLQDCEYTSLMQYQKDAVPLRRSTV